MDYWYHWGSKSHHCSNTSFQFQHQNFDPKSSHRVLKFCPRPYNCFDPLYQLHKTQRFNLERVSTQLNPDAPSHCVNHCLPWYLLTPWNLSMLSVNNSPWEIWFHRHITINRIHQYFHTCPTYNTSIRSWPSPFRQIIRHKGALSDKAHIKKLTFVL